MGRSAFSGPVYGAKATLLSAFIETASTGGGNGSTIVLGTYVVPTYEDWFVTEVFANRASTGSTGLKFSVIDDGSTIASATINSSLADASTAIIAATDGGEYEGTRIAAGSTVQLAIFNGSSGLAASSRCSMIVRGFTRLVDSTRAF